MDKWFLRCKALRKKMMRPGMCGGGNMYLLADLKGSSQASDMSKFSGVLDSCFRMRKDIKDDIFNYDKVAQNTPRYTIINDMIFVASNTMCSTKIEKYNNSFVIQLKGCNLNCSWCYVDDQNLYISGKESGWFSAAMIVDVFEKYRIEHDLNKIRISGGESSLTPELWLEILEEVNKRGLDKEVFVYAETNLANYYLSNCLANYGIAGDFWQKLAEHKNFAVWVSFRGTDEKGFIESSGINRDFVFVYEGCWQMLQLLVAKRLDVYVNVYCPNRDTVKSFFARGEKTFGENFWFRTWIQPIKFYEHRLRWKEPKKLIMKYTEEYKLSVNILSEYLHGVFAKKYRGVPRYGKILKERM